MEYERVHRIPSRTTKGVVYLTTRTSCTCKGFEYNHTCSHVTNLREWEKLRKVNQGIVTYNAGGALAPNMQMDPGEIIHAVVTKGDVSKMSDQELTAFVVASCKSLGVNPYTQPFDVISVRGGTKKLYPNAKLAEQLRARYGISCEIKQRGIDKDSGLYAVTVRMTDPRTGRMDESQGLMALNGATGQDKADLIMKCETKAKRRATFSFIGLGWVEDHAQYTDVVSMQTAQDRPVVQTVDYPQIAAPDPWESEDQTVEYVESTVITPEPEPVRAPTSFTPLQHFERLKADCESLNVDPALIPLLGDRPSARRINDGIHTLSNVKAAAELEIKKAAGK